MPGTKRKNMTKGKEGRKKRRILTFATDGSHDIEDDIKFLSVMK
jgi:hypothetical protein